MFELITCSRQTETEQAYQDQLSQIHREGENEMTDFSSISSSEQMNNTCISSPQRSHQFVDFGYGPFTINRPFAQRSCRRFPLMGPWMLVMDTVQPSSCFADSTGLPWVCTWWCNPDWAVDFILESVCENQVKQTSVHVYVDSERMKSVVPVTDRFLSPSGPCTLNWFCSYCSLIYSISVTHMSLSLPCCAQSWFSISR